MLSCAKCGRYTCREGKPGNLPQDCPMQSYGDVYEEAGQAYQGTDGRLAYLAAKIEATGYGIWPRLREIMEFSNMAGFTRLGLAFCVGLRREALEVTRILENNGFTVLSVICKTGAKAKEELGIRDEEKVRPGRFEAMCNPIAQAKLLNVEKPDLNILLGLCVGHDTLFIKHSHAPITVLAAKDRVTGHNPLAAIYASHYFSGKLQADK
ncbi:MAG TPA: metal-binding protein [Pelotomaculum sp.]|nr:metal-binding protein [Pelotomaculum sp.]